MATTRLSARLLEARRSPRAMTSTLQRVSVERTGYVPGIPVGGATDSNPGQNTTSGALDRGTWMDQLFQAYLSCPWVSDCVDVIASTVTAGGIQVMPNSLANPGGPTPTPPPEVQAVQTLLTYINDSEDVRQLMREIVIDLLVFGDSYTEVGYHNGLPVALWPLDPRTMDVLADEHGDVTGFHQKMETGQEVHFNTHEVIHVKLDSPGGGLYGVSPTQKNYVPITNWLFTSGLIQETMRRGDPPRLWIDWPMGLPLSDRLRLQQQMLVRNLGSKNIGNPLETQNNTNVKELGVNKIRDWIDTAIDCRNQIISGFGVPPSKVGVIESANIGGGQGTSQDRTFKVNTCGPLSEIIMEKFSFRLLNQCYGVTDWHLKFGEVDWRDDETLETIRDMRIRNGLWTRNRAAQEIGEPPVEGGDVAIIVDRQNLTAWADMPDLSKANLQAVQAKGAPPAAGAAPGTSPAPGGEEDDDLPYMTPHMEDRARKQLRESWRSLRPDILKELSR